MEKRYRTPSRRVLRKPVCAGVSPCIGVPEATHPGGMCDRHRLCTHICPVAAESYRGDLHSADSPSWSVWTGGVRCRARCLDSCVFIPPLVGGYTERLVDVLTWLTSFDSKISTCISCTKTVSSQLLIVPMRGYTKYWSERTSSRSFRCHRSLYKQMDFYRVKTLHSMSVLSCE